MSDLVFKHLNVRNVANVAVVDFINSGVMFETAEVQAIGDELTSLLKDHHFTQLLLDFRNVQYVSSTMLAQLAKLGREVVNAKGQLRICGLGPVLSDTFRIGHFDQLFAIYDDEASALKSFH